MKKISILLLLISIFSYGQTIESVKINSKNLNQEREILIYKPIGFEENTNQKYDVIYVFDSQMKAYFDLVHSSYDFYNKGIFPAIVVGIISPFDQATKQSRNTDLLPKPEHPETIEHYRGYLGNSENFFKFLTDEVSPYLEKNCRTSSIRTAVGHSNGGTFISYCFLEKPDFFESYILVSPNYAYDQFQIVKKLQQFHFENLTSKKFFYMCNANEAESFPKDWEKGNLDVAQILQKASDSNYIKFVNQDFSKTEDHGSIPPIGISLGLKSYMDFYTNTDNLLENIAQNRHVSLTADQANSLAYIAKGKNKTQDAIKVLLWANKQYPENLNIYDSIGEMYQLVGDKANANKYYKLFDENIDKAMKTLSPDEYKELKEGAKGRLDYLKTMK